MSNMQKTIVDGIAGSSVLAFLHFTDLKDGVAISVGCVTIVCMLYTTFFKMPPPPPV